MQTTDASRSVVYMIAPCYLVFKYTQKKGTKTITGAVPVSKGTKIYHLYTNMCIYVLKCIL